MKRALWIAAVIAAGVAGFLVVRGLGILAGQLPQVVRGHGAEPGAPIRTVQLFFGARDRVGFVTEDRAVLDPGGVEPLAETIAREVIAGPVHGVTGLPSATKVRAFYLAPDGTGYLDLSAELLEQWPRGDGLEWVSLGSLVRSLAGNLPEIRSVQILVEGHVVERSPGSIPLDLPLDPDLFTDATEEVSR